MRVLLIVNHPYEGSFSRALATAAARGAVAAGHEVDVIDLDVDGFDPVMRRDDLGAWRDQRSLDPLVAEYQERLFAADHVVMVFPVWWEVMPALTKGFFDKVLVPGTTYTENSIGALVGRFHHLRGVTVVTTMTTPGPVYRWWFGSTVHKAVVRGVFRKLRVRRVRWVNHARVAQVSPERRAAWLASLESRMHRLPRSSRQPVGVPVPRRQGASAR
ncbi:NAD(P)H-dependent oxidoreductase [Oerskovia flava]|uniref:NAD(P)H-dependent oxidoreductase n=1 Tax=Oerskovia flava TaxID=2986422 RepID=UPI00223E9E43|nr:NAD(P)H-dependent oxidoreductase [Oerskovia sp. JB1-3-2]